MLLNKRKGQSTVEYIVLVTAVVAVGILFLTSPNGPFQTKLNSSMTTVSDQMVNMADRITNSQNSPPGASGNPPITTNVIP